MSSPLHQSKAEKQLSRRIWRRNPNRPCRFWFSKEQAPHLLIESLGKKGRASYVEQIKKLKSSAPKGTTATLGGLTINKQGRFVFFGPKVDSTLLESMAEYVSQNLDRIPALAGLIHSTCATVDVEIRDDEALQGIAVDNLIQQTSSKLWDQVLKPSIAGTAAVLSNRDPGRRMWFWFWPDAPLESPALIVVPTEWDPNMDRLEQLISKVCPEGSLDTFTGVCIPTDDGRLQFFAPGLVDEVLALLARWALHHISEHPGLARLHNCDLVSARGKTVQSVIQLPELWADFPLPVVPGTLSEVAAVISNLEVGQDAWFWQTASGPKNRPFLTMLAVQSDPEAVYFNQRTTSLYHRFQEAERVIAGTARRQSSGGLLFTTSGELFDWKKQVRHLIKANASTYPQLTDLKQAKIIRVEGGKITAIQAVKSNK